MKNILFIKSWFIWKHATFGWDWWRLKVYVQAKPTMFAIITTQNNDGVVNQSILFVGCLVQIKVLMAFFKKICFAGQKISSKTQTSSTKVKCFSLARGRSFYTHWSCCKQSPVMVCVLHMKSHSLPLHCLQSNPSWALTQQSIVCM